MHTAEQVMINWPAVNGQTQGLPRRAHLVFGLLVRRFNRYRGPQPVDVGWMRQILRYARATIYLALQELKAAGLITIERLFRHKKSGEIRGLPGIIRLVAGGALRLFKSSAPPKSNPWTVRPNELLYKEKHGSNTAGLGATLKTVPPLRDPDRGLEERRRAAQDYLAKLIAEGK